MKKPATWSYSALSQFEKCPKQYEFARVQRLPQPPSAALERGNKVHAQLERALRSDASEAGVPEVSLIEYVADLKAKRPIVEEMWHFDREWRFVGTEFTPRSWLLVKMDAYVPRVAGKKARPALVVDWKTGRQYPEHETQGELYSLAALAKDGGESVDVDMVYVDQAHIEKWTVTLGDTALEEAQGEWGERARTMLGTREYRATPGKACNWCPFSGRKKGPCRAG